MVSRACHVRKVPNPEVGRRECERGYGPLIEIRLIERMSGILSKVRISRRVDAAHPGTRQIGISRDKGSRAYGPARHVHANVRPTLRRWRSQTKFNVNLCVDPRVGQVQDAQFSCAPRRVSSVDGDGNDRSRILFAADFPAFGARCRRGCLCDGRALVSADAPGRGNKQHQSCAVRTIPVGRKAPIAPQPYGLIRNCNCQSHFKFYRIDSRADFANTASTPAMRTAR